MLTIAGYHSSGLYDHFPTKKDFFVPCCGRYKLLTRKLFFTERPGGTNNYQLLYIAGGQADFVIQGSRRTIKKGYCVLFHPGESQYYYYHLKDKPDIYWIHFECTKTNPLFEKLAFHEENVFFAGIHNSYLQLFDQIIYELQIKDSFFEEKTALLLQSLLINMSREMKQSSGIHCLSDQQIEEALLYFNNHANENFTIKDYTAFHSLNYYRFIDAFTKHTGLAPRQYIIHLRMSKAKELLSNDTLQVSDVAELVGYENPLYFSRLFKQVTGYPPTAYKIRQLP